MPAAFLQVDQALLRACAEQVVVTANDRLRRELVRAFDAEQQAQGRKAWASANVWSLERYLTEQYRLLRERDAGAPTLLAADAQRLLFQTTAVPALQGLSELALQAWQLAHNWQIPLRPGSQALMATENGRAFLDWAAQTSDRLQAGHAITQAQLPAILSAAQLPAPQRLLALGFEATPKAIADYFDSLQDAGTQLEFRSASAMPRGKPVRCEFANPSQELNHMSQWVRELLEDSESPADLRIGVVIPNLQRRHLEVERQFGAELAPAGLAGDASDFDIAGGIPLGSQAIWRTARDLLDLCLTQLPSQRLLGLLHSRYLALTPAADLPAPLANEITLWELVANYPEPRLLALNLLCPPPGTRSKVADWLELFARLLSEAGLQGTGAQSTQYQAWEQVQNCLRNLTAGADFYPPCTAEQALGHLQQVLDARLFAPQTAAAPVQIMGYLETTGLQFTHLWVSGMEDTHWPASPNANPLIPRQSQLEAGVPRVDPAGELAFARSRMAQWQASSDHIVFSYARQINDGFHGPSPLLDTMATLEASALLKAIRPRSHPFLERRPGCLEAISDETGSKVPAGAQRGGTNLLRDQAQCPFRGWAIHRLGLREARDPHAFPDALDRGILVHEALRILLSGTDKPANPRHPNDVTEADITSAVERALRLSYGRFPPAFVAHERERLHRLLAAWLQLEAARGEFSVIGLETQNVLDVGGLQLQIRLDRIDRIEDGLAVIDYKTGKVSAHGLLSERLLEPQLPAYAMSHDGVSALLFAQLNELRPRLVGLTQTAREDSPVRSEALPSGGWDALQDRWRTQLGELAAEFRQGYAAVLPATREVCQRCHLQAVCRVAEEPPA